MLWTGFQKPKRVEFDAETLTPNYGRFTAQPFERGFATTIGNALRRCLLSSIEGAAITAVNIEGVLHEFSSIPGVVEDVTDIILNLKQVPFTPPLRGAEGAVDRRPGPGQGHGRPDRARTRRSRSSTPTSTSPPSTRRAGSSSRPQVKRGRGYVSADRNFDESMGIG